MACEFAAEQWASEVIHALQIETLRTLRAQISVNWPNHGKKRSKA